jgi:hypothetical protein
MLSHPAHPELSDIGLEGRNLPKTHPTEKILKPEPTTPVVFMAQSAHPPKKKEYLALQARIIWMTGSRESEIARATKTNEPSKKNLTFP